MAGKKVGEAPKEGSRKAGTMTRKCPKGCTHTFQDRTYGVGVRLFNLMPKAGKARCTVCSTVVDV